MGGEDLWAVVRVERVEEREGRERVVASEFGLVIQRLCDNRHVER